MKSLSEFQNRLKKLLYESFFCFLEKEMKLLITGWYYLIYPIISAKEMFEILGYQVIFFPLASFVEKFTKQEDLAAILLKFFEDFEIDIVLWWHWECPAKVMKQVQRETPHILHCLFNWDHPFCLTEWDRTCNRKILERNIWEVAFVTSKDHFQEYLESGTKEVVHVPMFADEETHYPKKVSSFECDVSFVLTNLYTEKEKFTESYMDRKTLIHDLIQAGVNIHLYGSKGIQAIFPQHYKGEIDFTENHKVFSNSKISLCTHVTKGDCYFNERVGTILSSGGLLCIDPVENLEEFLTDGEHCIVLRPHDYVNQILEILANYSKYEPIREKGLQRSREIFSVKKWAQTMHQYFQKHQKIPKAARAKHPDTVSIVMTYFDRFEQIKQTLRTIEETAYPKDRIEVLCFDDRSEIEPLIINTTKFTFQLKLFYGKKDRDSKILNSSYSYNCILGFATGKYIILQNSECMHIGDIISKSVKTLQAEPMTLLSFPCFATGKESVSKKFFDARKEPTQLKSLVENTWSDLSVLHYPDELKGWYNEITFRPQALHFCNAFDRETLHTVGFFDSRFVHFLGFDDNDYAERFMFHHGINIIIPGHEEYHLFVVHQYHGKYTKPRPPKIFLEHYCEYRNLRFQRIRNIETVSPESKVVRLFYKDIQNNKNDFLEHLQKKWATSFVRLSVPPSVHEDDDIAFLRKCQKHCNFLIEESV